MRPWRLVPLSIGLGALVATACVGDDPASSSGAIGNEDGGGVKQDGDAPVGDAASGDASDAGPSCAYAAKVREDHPLHYYRFGVAPPPNEGSADGGVGADSGPIDAPGAVACEASDKAARLDGTRGIEVFGQLDAPYNTPFSIELFFEAEAGSAAFSRLFSRETFPEAPATLNLHGYALIYDQSMTPRTVIFTRYEYKDAGTAKDSVFVTLEDKVGFRHVAATFDGTNMKVYIDGAIRGTVPSTVQPKPSPTARTFIGARIPPSGTFDAKLKGRIDEVAYYNYALPAERIAVHAAALQ